MNLAYIMEAQSMLTAIIITIHEYLILEFSKISPFSYLTEIKLNRHQFPQVWWCQLDYVPNFSIDWLEANAHMKNILPCTFILLVGGLGKVCICLKTHWEVCPGVKEETVLILYSRDHCNRVLQRGIKLGAILNTTKKVEIYRQRIGCGSVGGKLRRGKTSGVRGAFWMNGFNRILADGRPGWSDIPWWQGGWGIWWDIKGNKTSMMEDSH